MANLDGAVEDSTDPDPVLEDPVYAHDGAVRLLRLAVRHVVNVNHHLLLHPSILEFFFFF